MKWIERLLREAQFRAENLHLEVGPWTPYFADRPDGIGVQVVKLEIAVKTTRDQAEHPMPMYHWTRMIGF